MMGWRRKDVMGCKTMLGESIEKAVFASYL